MSHAAGRLIEGAQSIVLRAASDNQRFEGAAFRSDVEVRTECKAASMFFQNTYPAIATVAKTSEMQSSGALGAFEIQASDSMGAHGRC